jgi:hypothetical protein
MEECTFVPAISDFSLQINQNMNGYKNKSKNIFERLY